MMTTSSLTELRQAALALWRRQRQDLERDAARQAAERALDEDGEEKLEYDHTFDEQLWLRSNCPACGGSGTRITPIGSVLELGQALDGLQEARGTSGDDDEETDEEVEEAGESEEEAEDELTEGLGRGRG